MARNLLEIIKSLFGRKEVPKTANNNGKVAKKPYRGPTLKEIEDALYADKQPDYGEGHIKNEKELKPGNIYFYLSGQAQTCSELKFRELEGRKVNFVSLKTRMPISHDLSYFGLTPEQSGKHIGKWRKYDWLSTKKSEKK